MNRAQQVINAARDALAILEGNHRAGAFAQPDEAAADTIRAALILHDEPRVRDGGYAWDNTIAGILIYDSGGKIAVHVKPDHVPQDEAQRAALIHDLAALLNLATFEEAAL